MGVSKGKAGIEQAVDTAVGKVSEGFARFIGEEYNTEDQARIREELITKPEVVKQKVYAQARKNLTGDAPNFIASLTGEALSTAMIGPQQAGAGVLKSLFQSAASGGVAGGMECRKAACTVSGKLLTERAETHMWVLIGWCAHLTS
jgi:hypothetical protein